ncbi:helix-turn-helix transcriptional regulator [Ekhidna sp.]|uniref:helix-turn-helix domain-containing protein n=1 Tax=Ekhidna sp. TaxID=2608089 RepID=UPI0032998E42
MIASVADDESNNETLDELLIRFGKHLRSKRESLGLTSAEMARKSDIGRGNYANIESGKKDLQLSTIMKLCKGFGLSYYELFEGFRNNP